MSLFSLLFPVRYDMMCTRKHFHTYSRVSQLIAPLYRFIHPAYLAFPSVAHSAILFES